MIDRELVIDCAGNAGRIRSLHGINNGPLHVRAGEPVDLSELERPLAMPFRRIHDAYDPAFDVADMHAVFPDPGADPENPASYDFRKTDRYIAAIFASGAEPIYRLGESIEHAPVKKRVHPPADLDRWVGACLGTIRHYTEGWAHGFHYPIRYWEIWNEPENQPPMWTGTNEQWFELYRRASRAIKARFPQLKVGGPAIGNPGELVGTRLEPSAFLRDFMACVRRDALPLDFFSWHVYTAYPSEVLARARAIRCYLDEQGLAATENHLNEWNLLPGNSWDGFLDGAPEVRERFRKALGGLPGALFVGATLLAIQDAPLEVSTIYADGMGEFGLLDGMLKPRKRFHAIRAFRRLLEHPARLPLAGGEVDTLAACAGRDEAGRIALLLVNRGKAVTVTVNLQHPPWSGVPRVEVLGLDETRDLEPVTASPFAADGTRWQHCMAPDSLHLVLIRE